ncbi:hypothetical protein [Streptomyces omiyaensis]|uniref:Uncharacterized protein n=1 Tax=Streptomyces omiyaensis TaxID=68247 RepID=A0ABW7C3N7_9ACTN|nr:hypothetical protein [Streptomyces omiyaensis]GGY80471.1 hypothetical protein GCM10010363_71700 [Streptomyces omiyaensis]
MNRDLLHQVELLLADAGYGADSGLTATSDGPAVVLAWTADPLVRPLIDAHAADPDIHAIAGIHGFRAALETALTSVFQSAGLTSRPDPGGLLRVTSAR